MQSPKDWRSLILKLPLILPVRRQKSVAGSQYRRLHLVKMAAMLRSSPCMLPHLEMENPNEFHLMVMTRQAVQAQAIHKNMPKCKRYS